MDLINLIKQSDINLLLLISSSLIAFLTWIVKGAIEKPINSSKSTFESIYNIRIEFLIEIKNRLSFLLYFERGKDNKKYKNQIQNLLLKDGKSAYLSKVILNNTLRISIEEQNQTKLIKHTIILIDKELYSTISKIEDEIKFYRKFSNFNPIKRIIGVFLLALQNIITIGLIGIVTYYLITPFFEDSIVKKVMSSILSIVLLALANWYLSKK